MALRRVRKGEKIQADHINALIDAINGQQLVVAAPLNLRRNQDFQVISLTSILPRLARTTSTGNYPTRADTYNRWEIEFVDATYEQVAGPDGLEVDARSYAPPYSVASNIHNDPFVPEGTLLLVWFDSGRWWFDYEDEIQRATLEGELDAGGTVSVKVQVGGVDAPGGAVSAVDKLGVMTGSNGEACYIKWQRQHAEYWIIQKECDNSIPSTSPFITPSAPTIEVAQDVSPMSESGAF